MGPYTRSDNSRLDKGLHAPHAGGLQKDEFPGGAAQRRGSCFKVVEGECDGVSRCDTYSTEARVISDGTCKVRYTAGTAP